MKYKIKNKLIIGILKLIKKRKDQNFIDLILYELDGLILRNLNKDVLHRQKKVLICYLLNMQDDQQLLNVSHTNIEEKYIIVKYFIENGYQIDICDCRNVTTIKKLSANEYDIIFGFGPAYQWAYKQWKNAFHIEYYTESPYWYSAVKERERVEYYNRRTGKNATTYRTGLFYQNNDEYNADAIICMCDETYFKGIKAKPLRIYPHGLYNKQFEFFMGKDSKSFLFFGTAGYIHKGLDITIEAFKQTTELRLYVCGGMEKYIIENGSVPENVIDCGKVNVQSNEFLNLANKCMFVILPSCSEASPSSVLTCMRHGIIPIVSRGLGLDELKEYCFFLESFKIEYINRMINFISHIDKNTLDLLSQKIYAYANEMFSLQHFKEEFYISMKKIVEDIDQSRN